MKKSKLARLIAAICCFAMLLAACSSNQTPAESGGDGSTTADSEKKVLTYAIGAENHIPVHPLHEQLPLLHI